MGRYWVGGGLAVIIGCVVLGIQLGYSFKIFGLGYTGLFLPSNTDLGLLFFLSLSFVTERSEKFFFLLGFLLINKTLFQ